MEAALCGIVEKVVAAAVVSEQDIRGQGQAPSIVTFRLGMEDFRRSRKFKSANYWNNRSDTTRIKIPSIILNKRSP